MSKEIEKQLPVGSDALVLPLPGFTPGPWVCDPPIKGHDHINVWEKSGIGHVAAVSTGLTPDPSAVSNARLIAAAPAMFEALRKIAANPGWMDDEFGFMSGHIAKAALREASGQNREL